jgi:hypothetical protein
MFETAGTTGEVVVLADIKKFLVVGLVFSYPAKTGKVQ